MKKKILALGIIISIAVGIAVGVSIPLIIDMRLSSSRKDYREAESLVQLIWPLAAEMQEYADIHGRLPNRLSEIDAYSRDHDFSPLEAYRPTFPSNSEQIFFLRVNSNYAFEIDREFKPGWVDSVR